MAKAPITALPIHVYTCLTDPDRMCLATIGDLPILFKAETPMRVRRMADDWRRDEIAKIEARKHRAAEKRAGKVGAA